MLKKEFKKNSDKLALKKFAKLNGVNDLLSYLFQLEDHIVFHKDGALSAHFNYQAPDLNTCTEEQLISQSAGWQHALGFLDNGWMIETNVMSHSFCPHTYSQEFPELVSALIDDERKLQFRHEQYYTTKHYLSLTFKPSYFLHGKAYQIDSPAFQEMLLTFKKKVSEVVGYLQRQIHITPLSGDELTTFLFQCMHGTTEKLAKPSVGCFLNSYLCHEDFIGGFNSKIGNKHIRAIAINDLPSHSYPTILDSLNLMPLQYRWSTRFKCLDTQTANSHLKAYERNWSSKAIGILGVIRESLGLAVKLDEDAEQQAGEVRAAQVENNRGDVRFGFYSSTLVLIDEDEEAINKNAEDIANHIQRLNFKARIETINSAESYLGSLPCHGSYNLRKLLVDTRFVSHALPLSHLYLGEANCPCPLYEKESPPLLMVATAGRRPFALNLHVGDVGHTAILGPTGSGKSILVDSLILGHRRYENSRVIVLDKDGSHRNLIKALQGHYIDFTQTSETLSPLANISVENTKTLEQAQQWLSDCCESQGIVMTPERQLQLRSALLQLTNEPREYRNLNHLSLQLPELRESLQSLNTGLFQKIMNGTDSCLKDKSIIGIEMGLLLQHEKSNVSMAIVQAIFNELFSCFEDKRPTLLVLEEAWAPLKHPLIAKKLVDWFKTLRKYNVALLFLSQEVSDIANSPYAAAIQNACMTRIYLPNPAADELEVKRAYYGFGLNDIQIDIIQKAIPKQDYYYDSPLGSRLFSLQLGELAESILCIPDKKSEAYFHQCLAENNLSAWLEFNNLQYWTKYMDLFYPDALL